MNRLTIFVAGHQGMVGSAIVRELSRTTPDAELIVRTKSELDLTSQAQVRGFFRDNRIDQVYIAAAKVGGIIANDTYPADFIHVNLAIQTNVIAEAYASGVQRLLFLGSSCIYPRNAEQPMREDSLLTGTLEPTNEPYAIAKIAGIKMCESYARQYGADFRSVMPTNLYGPNDNFHAENSHVIPALIRRFHAAKIQNDPNVVVWGTGRPKREFMHVDDMASACVHVMNIERDTYRAHTDLRLSHINVGVGEDVTIENLASLVAKAVGYRGQIVFDPSKPDGTPRKLLDVTRLQNLGWRSRIELASGLQNTYEWFLANENHYRT